MNTQTSNGAGLDLARVNRVLDNLERMGMSQLLVADPMSIWYLTGYWNRPGVTFAEIDLTARRIIEEAGYGEYFTHRLGHQIGLEDHEPGDVSSAHHEPVRPGQCSSIEPGIYLPGEVGVRIEDLVIVTEDGCEIMNRYPKRLTVLG